MKIISTDKFRCKKCYACVRVCPVNAINVQEDGTAISYSRCINCGDCVDACSQGAIKVTDTLHRMENILEGQRPTYILLDTNWPISFPDTSPEDFEASLKKEGFAEVRSSLLAVEYTLKAYETILEKQRNPFIGSLCLIASSYVEKHTPNLIEYMIPVVIPALSTARYLRARTESPIRIVLATSCLALRISSLMS